MSIHTNINVNITISDAETLAKILDVLNVQGPIHAVETVKEPLSVPPCSAGAADLTEAFGEAQTGTLAPRKVDSAGVAWDPDLHSSPPKTKKDGTWRARRNRADKAADAAPALKFEDVVAMVPKLVAGGVAAADANFVVKTATDVDIRDLRAADVDVLHRAKESLEALAVQHGVEL